MQPCRCASIAARVRRADAARAAVIREESRATSGQPLFAGLGDLLVGVARELAKVRFPFGLAADSAAELERHMRAELDDMDASYEQVWGRPRPSGR